MSRRRGTALILAIFFLGLCQLLALGYGRLVPVELNAALRYKMETGSALAADSGIEYALAYIQDKLENSEEPVPGPEPKVVLRSASLEKMDLNGWEWEVTITPDDQTPPLGTNPRRAYSIESRAINDDRTYRVVTAACIQESFVKYASFTNRFPADVGFWGGAQYFKGPVHSNQELRVALHPGYQDNVDNGDWEKLFQGKVTSVQPIVWIQSGDEPQNAHQESNIFAKGHQEVKKIPVPWEPNGVRESALSGKPAPASPGVLLPTGGGVYVKGTVDQMVMGVNAQGNPYQKFTVNGQDWKVVEDLDSKRTRLTGPGGLDDWHPGLPNGAIYVAGDINGLHGENKGRHTVAVSTQAKHVIKLDGDLLQAGAGETTKPKDLDNKNALGLIGYKIAISSEVDPVGFESAHGRGLILHAAVMAGNEDVQPLATNFGGLETDGFAALPAGDHNYWDIVGSVVVDYKNITASITEHKGWTTRIAFDSSLQDAPPPCFPAEPELSVCGYTNEYEGQ